MRNPQQLLIPLRHIRRRIAREHRHIRLARNLVREVLPSEVRAVRLAYAERRPEQERRVLSELVACKL